MGEHMHYGKSSYAMVGIVGSALYGLLLLLSMWQTWCAWKILQSCQNLKFVFHVAMTTYFFFEVLYCFSLILRDGYSRWGYSGHVLALFCYVYAFATVIYLWGNTMSFGSRFEYPKRAGVFVVTVNLLISIVTIIFILVSPNFGSFQDHYSVVNLLLVVTHSVCLMILSLSMLWYGIRLQQTLGGSSLKAIPGKNRKIAILLRINVVLFVCCVCFLIRVIALAMLVQDIILDHTFTDNQIWLMGWFVMSNWIPTSLPALTLLFIMRVKETPVPRGSTWTDRDTDQTTAHKRSTVSLAAKPRNPAIEERPRQRSVSSELEEGDLESEDGFNPVHHTFRVLLGESFYIESQSPAVPGSLRGSGVG